MKETSISPFFLFLSSSYSRRNFGSRLLWKFIRIWFIKVIAITVTATSVSAFPVVAFYFFPLGFFFPSSLQVSVTPARWRRLQVFFDPCFARCKYGTCSDEIRWSLRMVGRPRKLDEVAGRHLEMPWSAELEKSDSTCSIFAQIYAFKH